MDKFVLAMSLGEVLDNLGSERPDWGGGSAVLLGAAMGSCMYAMAARVSLAGVNKGTFALPAGTDAEELQRLADYFSHSAEELAIWAARDGSLYGKVVAAQRMPKELGEQRARAIDEALRGAIEGPLQVAELIVAVLRKGAALVPSCKRANLSDISSGTQMLWQGVRGALLNVNQNCGKRELFSDYRLRASQLEGEAKQLAEAILAAC